MITLKLYPTEFRVLIAYLRHLTDGQQELPLTSQTLSLMVLKQYLDTWKAHRFINWTYRNPAREYKLSLSLTVARALYQELQADKIVTMQQVLLNKLDQAIVNYRNPNASAHVIGELVRLPQ